MSRSILGDCRNNLQEGIENLYESGKFSDVTYRVGNKKFHVHKLILSSRCSEFKRILMDTNSLNEHIIEDESVTEIGFEILMRFIYTDKLGTNDKLKIVQAYLAASHFKQKKMIEKCKEIMQNWSLVEDEVCELLNFSLGIPILKENCLNFIKRNASKVVSSPNFFQLNYQAMVAILENDALKDIQLKDRIAKVIEWGKKQKNNPEDLEVVRDYFLTSDPPLLGKLKIEELPVLELTELFTYMYDKLLEPSEIKNFLQYIHTKKKEVLPKWCTVK